MVSSPRPTPRPTSLGALLAADGALPIGLDASAAEQQVTGVCLDSRAIQPGDLYAALPGHVTHGARFAEAAVRAGAVAVLTDEAGATACAGLPVPVVVIDNPRAHLGDIAARAYGNPASGMQLLGVTGTNGKTTVAAMVAAGLEQAGRVIGSVGTVGVQVAGRDYPGVRTTPEATDLQALLGVMRDAGADSVIMEVSSIAIEEHRVDGMVFDVVAFTNLTQDHLDYHGTMADYFRAKAELFTPRHAGRGIVGVDDEWGRALAAGAEIPIRTWSLLDPHADWHVTRDASGLSVVGPDGVRNRLVVPMPGAFNVANAVCAIAQLDAAGVALDDAVEGIARARVPGRMEIAGDVAGVQGVVDYAHSPDAVERVLRAARDAREGRVIVVLGAGGDRDRAKRPLMGQVAARLADVVVVTDDNPRSEDPAEIRRQVLDGTGDVPPQERAEVMNVGDRAAAITVAVESAESGDMVLVLGKGHEQGQEAAGVVTPFDDATVLRAALEARQDRLRAGGQLS